ncbi:MAG: hypothetical protein AVO33_01320 [delta proteobacterium ML8_F1]|nr:MAG: hypothetical protein AVO33_01320 [delta proteobacterium ML8_F1]
MKILITGAAGFIGFHLSKKLLDQSYQIIGESKFVDYDNLKETMEYIYGFLDFLYFITDDYLSS